MINFREIFDINYSYVGIGIILGLIFLIILLEREDGVKVIGSSFFVSGIVMLVVYLFGNVIIDSFSYRFFIEIISDNFFSNLIIFSVVSLILGGIGIVGYKYINHEKKLDVV